MKNLQNSQPNKTETPNYIVWTRMQAEAGQGLELIIQRKERERLEGGGRFFWGVGNPPSVMTNALARTETPVKVVFSKMKSRPKSIDRAPASTVIWRSYIDREGRTQGLPPSALITSRGESSTGPKKTHYALECRSNLKLELDSNGAPFCHTSYRNAGAKGAPVGASQVTSLLVPTEDSEFTEGTYREDMTATLVGGYWVKLVDPLLLSPDEVARINTAHLDRQDWSAFVQELRDNSQGERLDDGAPLLL